MNAMPKSQAIQHLQKVLDELALFSPSVDIKSDPGFHKLRRSAEVAVTHIFGGEGKHMKELIRILYQSFTYTRRSSVEKRLADSDRVLHALKGLLESMIEEVKDYWTDEAPAYQRSGESTDADQTSNKVFLVHGGNEMLYFSEREHGESPRVNREISPTVWGGISSLIQGRINDGSFGKSFSEVCSDNSMWVCGVDIRSFKAAIEAEIPALSLELVWQFSTIDTPYTTAILDVIEFCWRKVSKSEQVFFHGYLKHHHLSFDDGVGRSEFREDINRIFRRNGVAFTLTEGGRIERIVSETLSNELRLANFRTGDAQLNELLESARQKFLSPSADDHRDALEKLWDAWERLKTVVVDDKKLGSQKMLDEAAGSNQSKFRALLEQEAMSLTKAGNSLFIRHSETVQERLETSEHVDYLFHRMFALIHLILKTTGRVG